MHVIVKHVIVIEHDVYGDTALACVNMLAVLPEYGCHYNLEDATRVVDSLNDGLDDPIFDSVYILNHS